jgi:hypothetical protein
MRNCASGNLEIPGSVPAGPPRNDRSMNGQLFFTSGQTLLSSGRKASSDGMVATSL